MDELQLQLTVRNLYCYKCGLNFSDQDAFRNHHSSFKDNDCSSHSSSHSIVHSGSATSASCDLIVETDEDVFKVEESENYFDPSSDDSPSYNSDDSYSPTKGKNYTPKKKKRRKTENSPAVKKFQSTKSPIKSKYYKYENENVPELKHPKNQNRRIKSTASVLQPSKSINLSKYNDFIHCCKCFSTFYKLNDLIIHFDNCGVQRDDNFKDFKINEQTQQPNQPHYNNNNFSPFTNTTPAAFTSTTTVKDNDNEMLDSLFDPSLFSPWTFDQECAQENKVEEDQKCQEEEEQERNNNSEWETSSESASQTSSESERELKRKSKKRPPYDHKRRIEAEKTESEFPYKCLFESCSSLSFHNLRYLHQHQKEVHKWAPKSHTSLLLCPTCGKSITKPHNYLFHLNTHTDYKPYKCNFEGCDVSFVKRYAYLIHYRSHDMEKQFKCPENGCSESFTRKILLTNHIDAAHLGLTKYKCEQCEKQFSNSEDRLRHVYQVHREKRFVCEFENCGRSYKKNQQLTKHKVSHQTERPLECDVPGCGLKYKDLRALRHHQTLVHEKTQQRLCNECGKTCANLGAYKLHMRTHTNERPFVCHQCGLAFATGTGLKRHTATHSTEKNEKCRFCSKRFTLRVTCRRHEQTHTKLNPYKCAFCDVAFPDNRPLKKHVATQHTDEDFDLNNTSTYQREKPSEVWKQSKLTTVLKNDQ